MRLGELGVPTQEFSGRRFRAEFQIALPADFYAQAYGNAQLLLDAAFTAAVRPGSHVDVYVNEQIASNLPITASGGGLFQRERMQIPLRNFRPGVNRLWLEVVLDTESDARCLPGATLPAENRFVLFDLDRVLDRRLRPHRPAAGPCLLLRQCLPLQSRRQPGRGGAGAAGSRPRCPPPAR